MIAEIATALRRLPPNREALAAAKEVDQAIVAFVDDASAENLRAVNSLWARATRLHTQLTADVAEPPSVA